MNFWPEQLGKSLIVAGILLSIAGMLMFMLGKAGFFRLPGDLEFGGEKWKVYLPLASCVLISLIITFILWLIRIFRG